MVGYNPALRIIPIMMMVMGIFIAIGIFSYVYNDMQSKKISVQVCGNNTVDMLSKENPYIFGCDGRIFICNADIEPNCYQLYSKV